MKEKEFIQQHKDLSPSKVALLLSKKPELDSAFILSQINGLQKAKKKIPEFYENENIVYPTPLSMEQCSSEQTAKYKSTLFRHSALDAESSIIDLTGGFGVDSFYFSKQFESVTYLEPNQQLFDIATQNFKALGVSYINTINTSSEEFLKLNTQQFDVAYIDPSRRNENQRVYLLADCVPNIIELRDTIFKIASQILVKTAPLLDIKQSIKELKYVAKVIVVALNNDCKEVLYLLDKTTTPTIKIKTINLGTANQEVDFTYEEENDTIVNYSEPQHFLYEPNAALLKAGAFNTVANLFQLNKIAPNSHLYTSEKRIENLPGRTFKVEHVINYSSKEFKKLSIQQANIACRNFKVKPEAIKKKFKLKDGGDNYIFATTTQKNKPILICCVK